MLKKNKYLILFLGWVLVITVLSLFSFKEVPDLVSYPYTDKIVHTIFYLGFTTLAFLFFSRETSYGTSALKALTISCVLAWVYGIFIEVLQETLTRYRAAEWTDIAANTFGIVLACIGIAVFNNGNKPLK